MRKNFFDLALPRPRSAPIPRKVRGSFSMLGITPLFCSRCTDHIREACYGEVSSHLCHFLSLRRARNPTNQGERELMLDRQSSPDGFVLRETAGCCNKPYRPF